LLPIGEKVEFKCRGMVPARKEKMRKKSKTWFLVTYFVQPPQPTLKPVELGHYFRSLSGARAYVGKLHLEGGLNITMRKLSQDELLFFVHVADSSADEAEIFDCPTLSEAYAISWRENSKYTNAQRRAGMDRIVTIHHARCDTSGCDCEETHMGDA
jgi:hypothetical protein